MPVTPHPGKLLTPMEVRAILAEVERCHFEAPVAIVDRKDVENFAVLLERKDLLDGLKGDHPTDGDVRRMLEPCEWPFVRVLVFSHEGSFALRLSRARPGVGVA